MANYRVRRWYDCPVKGINRSSSFLEFSNYSDQGIQSFEERYSVNHGRWPDGSWFGGGPFLLNRTTKTYSPNNLRTKKLSGGGFLLQDGTSRIENPTSSVPVLSGYSVPSWDNLMADGTTAISRIEPTNPAFDLSVFIGELRADGLPNIPGTDAKNFTSKAKASGSEYLNIEFGWKPFIDGIRDFASTVNESDRIIRSYQERQSVAVSRSYEWATEQDSRIDNCSFSMTPGIGFFTGGGRAQTVERRKWLEADFIYYLPTGPSINDKVRRYGSYARKLLGVNLSPEVLWNLSPWSWAADWYTNAGDVLHNISAIGRDGQVMKHAYIMCHVSRREQDYGTYSNTAGSWSQTATRLTETKTRYPATPYGFGVSFDSLSVKQAAIVTALGISRWGNDPWQ